MIGFKKLLIASKNPGKAIEIKELLSEFDLEVLSALDFPEIAAPEETGSNFIENAEIKSRYYGAASKLATLSDDSGLTIPALGGFPGVFSSRVAEEAGGYANLFGLIESKLENLDPSAYFTCALSLWIPSTGVVNFEGRVYGQITFPAKGKNGFGYDPIFTPDGYNITFGQMTPAEKAAISHRSEAFSKFRDWALSSHHY